MRGRDPDDNHRPSTPLELLFDLTAVVAIALCAESLHHGLSEGHTSEVLIGYPMVFFAIWWAWMNFTWFGSAFDTDDAGYRLATLVQMAGSLVLAAGVPSAFDDGDFTTVTIGYVVMRTGLVTLWLRVRRQATESPLRATATRYVIYLTVLQGCWLGLLLVANPVATYVCFGLLVAAELTLPFAAQRAHPIPWHPEHIAERYGLFTIIVLGESVLSATAGVQTALDTGGQLVDLLGVVSGGLLLVFAMWWLYFEQPSAQATRSIRSSSRPAFDAMRWGYGHFAVFASAAATGAGLAVTIDQATHHSVLTQTQAAMTVTVPAAIYAITVWLLHADQREAGYADIRPLIVGGALVATSWLPEPVLAAGLVMATAVVLELYVSSSRAASPSPPAAPEDESSENETKTWTIRPSDDTASPPTH